MTDRVVELAIRIPVVLLVAFLVICLVDDLVHRRPL